MGLVFFFFFKQTGALAPKPSLIPDTFPPLKQTTAPTLGMFSFPGQLWEAEFDYVVRVGPEPHGEYFSQVHNP